MTNDPYMAMQHEAALAFSNVTRAGPGLPQWKPFEAVRLERYAAELADLARRMKADAAQMREQGYDNLALWLIRGQLSTEETGELLEAVASGDLAHTLNELVDLSYVTDGHYLSLGCDRLKLAAYSEVHAANMSKCVDGVGQVDASGRHIKGPGYRKPDLARVIKESS